MKRDLIQIKFNKFYNFLIDILLKYIFFLLNMDKKLDNLLERLKSIVKNLENIHKFKDLVIRLEKITLKM